MEFIVDRSQKDVERWRELQRKGFEQMSPEEKAEWLGPMKGCYGHTDMNRVERAVEALSAQLCEMGYLYHPTVKTDWARWSAPTKTDFERYLGNVAGLREVLPLYRDTPAAPTVEDRLNWSRANDIERILSDVEKMAAGINEIQYRAGEIFAGEV